jgi:hypothetical protein
VCRAGHETHVVGSISGWRSGSGIGGGSLGLLELTHYHRNLLKKYP